MMKLESYYLSLNKNMINFYNEKDEITLMRIKLYFN
jgi:hypothetical protein